MKRFATSLGAAAAAALILCGCYSFRTRHDYDPAANFSRYKTYRFAAAAAPKDASAPVTDPIIDRRVKQALEKALAAKGRRQAQGGQADFWVSFVLVIERYVVPEYYGYYGPYMYGWASVYPRTFEEGVLVVDILDAGTRKLVWRGSVSDALGSRRSPEARQAALDKAAAKLLKRFPPAQTGPAKTQP